MDDYIIDVYHIINPYIYEYKHLERIRCKNIYCVMDHLQAVNQKYDIQSKTIDYLVTSCKGEASANHTFEQAMKYLAKLPSKSEIN